ncbi:hypothetical protein [Viridibacillus arvi]|uniref:hypothetical protein n=1 Tax=Viridibacillus arvi TaxID=263475 RepID=UPI00187B1E33|nr:hypothetical protein [Viridibacillus sp. JNUCC-6]QOV11438.1 hypothetical protein JNUCC6_01195 [Viridibacillus sp. JNUCC-6]
MSEVLLYTSVTLSIIITIAFGFEKVFENRLFHMLCLGLIFIIGILVLINLFIAKQEGLSNLIRSYFVLMLAFLLLNFMSALVSVKRAIIWGTLWIFISFVLLISS